MSLIHLFRRLVFAQVLLGIVAFCMAEPNPGLLLVAGALGALSWYVTEGPAGRPLPRWAVNLGSIAAVAWLLFELVKEQGQVLVAMGHFTMWLQVLMLYSDKSNREYAQLLVLSLLQMIGASALPGGVSMIFGVLLTIYCIMALFTVLLFQLKLASDQVHEANVESAPLGTFVSRPKPVTSRGHRWQFRMTAMTVGAICGAVAVVVFILMPRRGDPQFESLSHSAIASKETGFSHQVQLSGGPPGAGRRDPVLNLTVRMHGANIGDGERAWLLRGAALDRYDSDSQTWVRSSDSGARDQQVTLSNDGVRLAELPPDTPVVEAEITLRGAPGRTLFSLHPVTYLSSPAISEISFNPNDQQLGVVKTAGGALTYRVDAPLAPPRDFDNAYERLWATSRSPSLPESEAVRAPRFGEGSRSGRRTQQYQALLREVERDTRRVLAAAGLQEDGVTPPHVDPQQIAQVIHDYLLHNFKYDLTNPQVSTDPILAFLRNHRSGHCELFASAMAVMAQSVGLPARVITGYRAGEYNRVGGYYIVRQSHAHAWAEVHVGDGGWRTYDPTPPSEVDAEHRIARSWFSALREFYDYLEFQWIRTVVAYDPKTREQLLTDINRSFQSAAEDRESWIGVVIEWFRELPQRWQLDKVSNTLVAVISFFIIVGCLSLVRTLIVRQRRLAALQLHALPRNKRRGMTRRLAFYLRMLDMLERHGYVRPNWQSPFGFAQELAAANPMRFDPVLALTELFYEIRFGHRDLDSPRKSRIKAHLRQLENALSERVA
jgi:transglutaminase-like putative cysteine protease